MIRRLSLDLTGLPPSLKEIDQFVADTSQRIARWTCSSCLPHEAVELASESLRFAISVARGKAPRDQLQRRRILHNPPGAPVFVRNMPYTFVDRKNMATLEDFWARALGQRLQKSHKTG